MIQSLHVRFQVADQVFHRVFDHMYHIPDDFREPFEQMAEEFWKQEAETFANEGAVGNFSRWKELSPRYKAWKEKHFPGQPILVRTGKLRASLTEPHADGAIYEVYPKEMTLGTEIPYAVYHQQGTWKMPARPPVLLTMELRNKWSQIIADWLRDEFAYTGRE